MIAIASENGTLLKVFSGVETEVVGYHPAFGFVTAHTFRERIQNRRRHGFMKNPGEKLNFSFQMAFPDNGKLQMSAFENCEVINAQEAKSLNSWLLQTPKGQFSVRALTPDDTATFVVEKNKKEKDTVFTILLLLVLLLPLGYMAMPNKVEEVAPQVQEPVVVKVTEVQKPVTVSNSLAQVPPELKRKNEFKRAIKQDLGFLGLLGRKDLNKALGGAPTQLKDASPGAGAGGTQGSGGEMLVGLGQGLKRTTVGNSGVAGLGGIGTKGAGGGQGGYGNSMIGSGEGRGLSSIPLAQDVVLEGGLDRSVVQATIAKYLNQVRACYEQGLKNNPGLAGLVNMNFEINGGGNLNFAKVGKTTLGDSEVEGCISNKMMTWKFPNPRGGVNVKVSYPFLLRSARS